MDERFFTLKRDVPRLQRQGYTIGIAWLACIVTKLDILEVESFFKDQFGLDVKVVGSLQTKNKRIDCFLLAKPTNITQFAITRLKTPDMKWIIDLDTSLYNEKYTYFLESIGMPTLNKDEDE